METIKFKVAGYTIVAKRFEVFEVFQLCIDAKDMGCIDHIKYK